MQFSWKFGCGVTYDCMEKNSPSNLSQSKYVYRVDAVSAQLYTKMSQAP